MNICIFDGYLNEKPMVEKHRNGSSYCRFSVPASAGRKDANGKYISEWHQCEAWGAVADKIGSYNKGDMILFTSTPLENRWKDDNGRTHRETVFRIERSERKSKAQNGDRPKEEITPEDLPF